MSRRGRQFFNYARKTVISLALLFAAATPAHADIDDHGSDQVVDAQPVAQAALDAAPPESGDSLIAEAESIVRALYEANDRFEKGEGPNPLGESAGNAYFTPNIVTLLGTGGVGAHPLYGAQDFAGSIVRIAPDSNQPMFRGMITINVDFSNFGKLQHAAYLLRADTTKADAPLRIFRVEHEGWSYP